MQIDTEYFNNFLININVGVEEMKVWIYLFATILFTIFQSVHPESFLSDIPGRKNCGEVSYVEFGSTNVFFYMNPEKSNLIKNMVEEINKEKIKLTVDINDFDCFTTELSAIASKYPNPISYNNNQPIFADPEGNATLDVFASSLKELISQDLNLGVLGMSREINFVVSQDAHKFHQDQTANQFAFLKQYDSKGPPLTIIQDLTLVDWDMSVDTFSATIVQDSDSKDRYLLTLFPGEAVGMLFTQSPSYLSSEAHPSYAVPTIFPYHAVLSPIDRLATKTPGSSKGKRLSTVLRGLALETQLQTLKENSRELNLNRPEILTTAENKKELLYPNGLIIKELPEEILEFKNSIDLEKSWVYKHPDKENVEILEFNDPVLSKLCMDVAKEFGIEGFKSFSFFRFIKKDSGFSYFDLSDLKKDSDSDVILLNDSSLPDNYDYFNLAQDFSSKKLPWIQLYHLPPQKACFVPSSVFPEICMTPVEEILFREAKVDSMITDGIQSIDKIVTKVDVIVLEK
ncbi:MAG: hypothetical protein S4CHLAM7_00010 [Chlamydiae bacterium]|nr:hypothetical protein [Chlamydiota bacterium]